MYEQYHFPTSEDVQHHRAPRNLHPRSKEEIGPCPQAHKASPDVFHHSSKGLATVAPSERHCKLRCVSVSCLTSLWAPAPCSCDVGQCTCVFEAGGCHDEGSVTMEPGQCHQLQRFGCCPQALLLVRRHGCSRSRCDHLVVVARSRGTRDAVAGFCAGCARPSRASAGDRVEAAAMWP